MKRLEKTQKRIERLTLVGIVLALLVVAGCTNSSDANESKTQPSVQDESDSNLSNGQTEPAPAGGELPRVDEVNQPACFPADSVAVSMDQMSRIGFAPADVAAYAIGTHETTIEWGDGKSEPAEMVVTLLSQEADVIHFESAGTGEGPVIEIACLDHMELPVEIAVKSENGTLDSSWMGTMTATSADQTNISIELNPASFKSILEQLGFDRFDEVSVRLSLELSRDGLDGEIFGIGTSIGSPEDDPDNTTVSAERFRIAYF